MNASLLEPLPPAREIPSAFTASLRSWYVLLSSFGGTLSPCYFRWSVGEKQSAISEERLLR